MASSPAQRRHWRHTIALAAVAAFMIVGADQSPRADEYPSRPVKMLVGAPPAAPRTRWREPSQNC